MTLIVIHLLKHLLENLMIPLRRIPLLIYKVRQLCRKLALQIVVIYEIGIYSHIINKKFYLLRQFDATFIGILKAMCVPNVHKYIIECLFLKRNAKFFKLLFISIDVVIQVLELLRQSINSIICYIVDKGKVVASVVIVYNLCQ